MNEWLPSWSQAWTPEMTLAGQVALILLVAWLLRTLLRRLIERTTRRYELSAEVAGSARRLAGILIGSAALLLILERLGVSGAVLWTAFTGFAAVAAVAFFAAWSVLSNIFCALLILVTRPFRLHDHIELVDAADKPGIGGRVIDMNLIYVTVEEQHPQGGSSVLRLPNSLFFQRATRRWHGEPEKLTYPQKSSSENAPRPPSGGGSSIQGWSDAAHRG
ncbi:mechanosensitive ion channel family protein [Dokdonella sp.]|uniref:mechanosensitive ion channel family protein n=1 Tax=Dokdonella sp. TaxID=2291710 RepID=UPI0025C4245A|nr:mechanosensitive ion channel family protein [Dokdonella sp.]MBX3691743.1 mechanosensitive ion channel family protein [Dokdonella sp.]MCW5568254.1 mechanosensitive ion channel family protein [Dokdonella sp.]